MNTSTNSKSKIPSKEREKLSKIVLNRSQEDSNSERVNLIYARAEQLRHRLITPHNLCNGTGYLYVPSLDKETLRPKTFPCSCYRRYFYSIELMIAGVSEDAIDTVIYGNVDEAKVKEIDIESERIHIDSSGKKYHRLKETTLLYEGHINPYIENPESVIQNGYSYLFTGFNSTGKTFASTQALFGFLRKGFSGHFILFRELMKLINRSITSSGEERKVAERLLDEIFNVDLLVIDELGKETGSKQHITGELESLLKERDRKNKPCIITSNEEYEDIVDKYTSQISDFSSVFMRSYRVLLFDAKNDFRKKYRKRWAL